MDRGLEEQFGYPSEALKKAAGGVVDCLTQTERIGLTEKPAFRLVRDVALQAVAKTTKKILGEKVESLQGMETAKLAYGGQDACGAVVFDGGRIEALLVAADGCSFGSFVESAKAARIAVETVLLEGKGIAQQPSLDRDGVLNRLERSLVAAHRRIQNEAKEGATTVAAAAISEELTEEGRKQTYLSIVSCGDAQVMILGRDRNGQTQIRRIVEPADAADRTLRQKIGDIEDIPVNLAKLARQELIEELARHSGLTYQEAEAALTQSGIYAFLGGREEELQIRKFRINLSRDRFAQGYNDVRIVVCTDYAGEKLSIEEIAQIYADGTKNNKQICEELDQLMAKNNMDDGCLVFASVGAQNALQAKSLRNQSEAY